MDTTTTEPPTKKKQGKIDRDLLFKLLTQENPPKKVDIAPMVGSIAKSTEGKITSVNNAISSVEMQGRLKKYREEQNKRALNKIERAEKLLNWDQVAENAALAFTIIDKSERLLQENMKQEDGKGSVEGMTNIHLSMPTSTLMNELEKLSKQKVVIEGEIST